MSLEADNLPAPLPRLRVCTPVPRPGSHPDWPLGEHVSLVEYAAMEPSKRWPANATLSYALFGGNAAAQAEFRQAVATLSQYVNLNLVESPGDRAATIRVSFVQDGSSWSLVGQDCKLAQTGTATMNLGWPGDLGRTIHELCHALGLMHNQAIPGGDLHLDRAKCYAYFGGPPNNWSRAMVDSQVLYLFSGQFVGSGFDRKSIMQYAVPDELTTDGNGIPWNETLSPTDVRDLRSYYPKATVAPPVSPPVVPPSVPPTPFVPTVVPATDTGAVQLQFPVPSSGFHIVSVAVDGGPSRSVIFTADSPGAYTVSVGVTPGGPPP